VQIYVHHGTLAAIAYWQFCPTILLSQVQNCPRPLAASVP